MLVGVGRCGWWCCIEARSAKVSIPGVEACLGGTSVGEVPFTPLGPGEDSPVGAYTCCARGEEVLPFRLEPVRVLSIALWGDGPAEVAGALFDVGPDTGVEFPDLGFESGERSELMSMFGYSFGKNDGIPGNVVMDTQMLFKQRSRSYDSLDVPQHVHSCIDQSYPNTPSLLFLQMT